MLTSTYAFASSHTDMVYILRVRIYLLLYVAMFTNTSQDQSQIFVEIESSKRNETNQNSLKSK